MAAHAGPRWLSSKVIPRPFGLLDCGYFAMSSLRYFSSAACPNRTNLSSPSPAYVRAAPHCFRSSAIPANSVRYARVPAPCVVSRAFDARRALRLVVLDPLPAKMTSSVHVEALTTALAGSRAVYFFCSLRLLVCRIAIFTHGCPSPGCAPAS